jgi:hypothetical protein
MDSSNSSLEAPAKRKHGGARSGAGRGGNAARAYSMALVWQRNNEGVAALKASDVLLMVNERAQWQRLFKSDDDRVVLQALTFLTSMRDGKPSQQINVHSLGVTITADEVSKARAIVRELMGGSQPPALQLNAPIDTSVVPSQFESEGRTTGEYDNVDFQDRNMLLEDEGGKQGGEG